MSFKNQALTLHSDAVPDNTLIITKLVGDERMSGLFRFELDLLCQDTELDLEAVLYSPVRLGIEVSVPLSGGGFGTTMREIAGVLAELEQQEEGQGWVKYRAVLVPKVWQLTRTHRSRIFMGKAIDELATAVLQGDGLEPKIDFELQLSRQGKEASGPARAIYPQREYVVQYEENDWDFVARWLEHEGVFFYFVNDDEGGGAEKMVFADTTSAYATSSFGSSFPYRPESAGKDAESDKFGAEEIYSFRCRQTRLPKKVTVNDYNWRTPSASLRLSKDVHDKGTGLQSEYNDHFKTEAQGKALAALRSEELACRARWFHGDSSCRTFRPGTTFELEEHFRDDFNASYLLVEVRHEAEQMVSLESSTVTGVKYRNSFHAIPATQCFRPERATPWPSIKGVIHAKVDAEGDGKYAELDEHGRYKLTLPFDEHAVDAKPGKASRWIRMAQPYAGQNAGMHFPLLKGTEVLVTHIDGDPDRPIIAAAVPNPESESPATGENATRNSIRTASGNVMQFDDDENASGIVIRDARGSRVSDFRWRTGAPTANTAIAAASQSPGGGGNELVSTVFERGATESVVSAWKDFFKETSYEPGDEGEPIKRALYTIATEGRYSDEKSAPLRLSPSNGLLGANAMLNEANVVTLLNHLLSWHPKVKSQAPSSTLTPGTQLSGKIASLAQQTRNFEGLATGSQLEVRAGDALSIGVGDSFEYKDCANAISITAGGFSREETRGASTKESEGWGTSTETKTANGDVTETSTTNGDKTSKEYVYGHNKQFAFTWGVHDNTEINAGLYNENKILLIGKNENTIAVGAVADSEVLIAGKFALEISLAGSLTVELGKKAEFKSENFEAILSSEHVFLKEMGAALNSSDAYLSQQIAALDKKDAALSAKKATLTAQEVALNKDVNALASQKKALIDQLTVLSGEQTALKASRRALVSDQTALTNLATSAFHSFA